MTDAQNYGAQVRQLMRSLGQPPNPLQDSLQLSSLELGFYDDTTRAVRRMDAVLARTDLSTIPFEQRPYVGLVGFYAGVGQTARARSLMARWESEIPDSGMRRQLKQGRDVMEALIALSEKNYPEALRHLWATDTTDDGPNGNCAACLYDDIAYFHARAGNADSALFWYEKYVDAPIYARYNFDSGNKPLMLKRMGELYESVGDVAKAALAYREFLALWDKADPRLQPKVADVRHRLSRLADMERR
jgi:hypothetical protein